MFSLIKSGLEPENSVGGSLKEIQTFSTADIQPTTFEPSKSLHGVHVHIAHIHELGLACKLALVKNT